MFDWERIWKGAGIQFAVLSIVAGAIYGNAPKQGASNGELVSFFDGDRTRVLIAAVVFCMSFLALLWFGAALASVLRDAGKAGWGAAATASSAAMGGMLFVLMATRASLAFSIAGAGHPQVTTAIYDASCVVAVMVSFPAAMFVMSGAFGLWRAGIISNRFFSVGVAAVVIVLLGGTTLARSGVWSPGGAYDQVSFVILLLWIAVLSGVLLRRPATASNAVQAPIPAA